MNKFRIILSILSIMMLSQFSYSQNDAVLKTVSHFDAMFGVGENVFTGGVSWNRTHGILKSKKLRLGYGLRFSGISGNDLYYATAPADLTSDPENIDSILVGSPLNLALNAAVYLEYLISPKLKVGFNIDAIGVGFGQSQNTTYFSHKNSGKHPTNVDADANSFNALLVGDNDLGYLKSEFYVGYALNEKMWIRGGMDMTFAEYTTTLKLLNDNDRFRAKPVMLFLGFSINPFN